MHQHQLVRPLVGVFVVVGFLSSAGVARADTDYLGSLSTPDQGFGVLSSTAWLAAGFTVTEARTVTGGTAVVTLDPATAETKQIVLYSAVNEAAANWPSIGTLAQTGFESAPDIAVSRWRVNFAGSVALNPGTYFVGVRELAGVGALQLNLGQGTQTSPWSFTKVLGDFKQYSTVDGGATWNANDFAAVGMITLSGPSPVSGEDLNRGPQFVIQQVGVPTSGSCADVDDSGLAWGTDVSGGWGASWASWNDGPVCTRTLQEGGAGWRVG